MKVFRKKEISILLSLLLLCALLPLPALAAESGTCGDGVKWSLSSSVLTVSGKGAMSNFSDDAPAPWSEYADSINRVVVESGVTSVGDQAFCGCENLRSVSLPDSVTAIGSRAFKECRALGSLFLPSRLERIGEAAFESCESLSGIRLPSGLRAIGSYAFYRCYSLSTITIPASVADLGMVVFSYCDHLVQAAILCPIEKLPDSTFYGCTSLTAVSLPDTVSTVGERVFYECGSLDRVYYSGAQEETLIEEICEKNEDVSQSISLLPSMQKTPETPASGTSSEQSNEPTSNQRSENAAATEEQKNTFVPMVSTATTSQGELDDTIGTTVQTTIKETENAIIETNTETEYQFRINGTLATTEEVLQVIDDDTAEVDVETKKEVEITASVENKQGWEEVAETVKNVLATQEKPEKVDTIVNIKGTTVSGEDLAQFAGQNIEVAVNTSNGDTWKFDASTILTEKIGKKEYELGVTVTEVRPGKTKIESDEVYKVKFDGDVDLNATVAVNVEAKNARQLATLYEKGGIIGNYEEVQTVVVDEDGNAWFSLAKVSKRSNYYVGINVEGVTSADAIIPDSLHHEYGIDDTTYLMDANGTKYQITGRTSRWGITGGQFAIYVAIAIGAVVLIVTLLMITLNKMKQSKLKYDSMTKEDEAKKAARDEIDEGELRLKVMQELLEEAQHKGK